jgi:hypothetical protein
MFHHKRLKPEYISVLFEKRYHEKSAWEDYSKNYFDQSNPDKRFSRILELIRQFSSDADSCLDIAGNSGYMCYLIAQEKIFNSIINLDYDENAIEYGRWRCKNENIEFYLGNPFVPFYDLEILTNSLQSDVLLALAVTHHLILSQHYRIGDIFRIISMYTRKYIYIEFCPLGMYGGGTLLPPIPEWYTEEWFEANFKKYFKLLHKEVVAKVEIAGKEKDHRVLYIGEK